MSIQAMNNILEQINIQANEIKGTSQAGRINEQPKTTNFNDILFQSINNISDLQVSAKSQAQQYMIGAPGVGLDDVMVSLQKSSVALNLGVQVRNKLVNAYQEIMNMSV